MGEAAGTSPRKMHKSNEKFPGAARKFLRPKYSEWKHCRSKNTEKHFTKRVELVNLLNIVGTNERIVTVLRGDRMLYSFQILECHIRKAKQDIPEKKRRVKYYGGKV